jgi:hypothetical protein
MTAAETYHYERGRLEQYRAAYNQRMACAPTNGARGQIVAEGDALEARVNQLADQVRAEARNAVIPVAYGAVEQRYRAAVGAIRKAVFPSAFWSIAPAPDPRHVDELRLIENRWARAISLTEREEVARVAEELAHELVRNGKRRRRDAAAPDSQAARRFSESAQYIRRAIGEVRTAAPWWNPIDQHAARLKTEPYEHELIRLERRWELATADKDRDAIARAAELLADRTQETLPGAPQDRQRTNLFKGEAVSHAPATSSRGEVRAVVDRIMGPTHPEDQTAKPTDWKTIALLGAAGVGALYVGSRLLLR